MSGIPKGVAIIAQSGGPTAVINQSLVGVVDSLCGAESVTKILGARHGVRGIVDESFVDLGAVPADQLERIARTPSAALGSTRDKPDEQYAERIVEAMKKNNVRSLFYIGGNDSSDTCRIVHEVAARDGYELCAYHVPKTIDNDLVLNDHTPGYPSAARYVGLALTGDNLDNAAIPGIKIDVIMGRHAGFLTGASALGRRREGDGPHLIYMPERAFDFDSFCADVERVYAKLGRCLIAVSEGIADKNHTPISSLLSEITERDAHGNIRLSGTGALGDGLSQMIAKKLTPTGGKPPRARADTLGYAQRYWPDASPVDQKEARQSGRFAVQCAENGASSGSIAIERVGGAGSNNSGAPYAVTFNRLELTDVAAKTRTMPDEFLQGENDVSQAFFDWLTPMVGEMGEVGWV